MNLWHAHLARDSKGALSTPGAGAPPVTLRAWDAFPYSTQGLRPGLLICRLLPQAGRVILLSSKNFVRKTRTYGFATETMRRIRREDSGKTLPTFCRAFR